MLNIVKNNENVPVLSQFVATSLADHFPHSILQTVLTFHGMVHGKCLLSVFHTSESEQFPGYGKRKVSIFHDSVLEIHKYLREFAAKIENICVVKLGSFTSLRISMRSGMHGLEFL